MAYRFKAAGTHLLLCTLVAALVFITIATAWFPGVFLETAGGLHLFAVVVGVDITLGPLLTFIVFKPGKKGLKFDLVVIALLQVGALAYGVYTLFEARPVYVVFVKDRFDLVRANEIEEADLAQAPQYANLSWTGPRLVAARLPTNPDEKFNMILSGIAGKDVQSFPRYYIPYESVTADVLKIAKPIAELRALNPQRGDLIDSIGLPDASMRFLPMRAGKQDLAVIVDPNDAHVIKYLALRPWDQ